MAVLDPTYPLYPIACIIASAMLLLVLTTSFVRQTWNLGVTFLCFWLFSELSTAAVNAIVWSDNADIKLYVYCDIVTHLQTIAFVVKPMATLIITRRLYLIASLQSLELPNKAAKRWDIALEWTLGLIIPTLVSGPIYYVNQGARFAVIEGFGCRAADELSIFDIIIEQSWTIIPPLISIIHYYPKVARTYYQQRRDIDSFLRSNPSVLRTNYFRILLLASIDILLTLPIGIPVQYPYAELQAKGTAELAQVYFAQWSSPILAFAIFGLFGVTAEARASYWHIICTIGGWFGWKPTPRARNGQASLGDIEFGARPQDASGIDLEMGSRTPSFINADVHTANQGSRNASAAHAALEGTDTDPKADEETPLDYKADATAATGSQDSTKHRAPAVEEPSDAVEMSSIVSVGTRVTVQGQDTTESVGGSTMREPQFDRTYDVVSDVPRATEYPKFTIV